MFAIVLILSLSGCTAPGEPAPNGSSVERLDAVDNGRGGGGTVRNVEPTVEVFQAAPAVVENAGLDVVTVNGTILDRNGEKDLRRAILNLTWTGVAAGASTHEVTKEETEAATGILDDGWTVWSGADDGLLHFEYAYPVARGTPAGDLTFQLSVDPVGAGQKVTVGPARTVEVILFSELTVNGIFHANGTAAGDVWGGWVADPGARNVTSNLLRITNTGLDPDTRAAIDFTDAAFTGPDASTPIPIDGNLAVGWWEGSPGASPDVGNLTWVDAPGGTAVLPFSDVGNVLHVAYRIDKLPDILVDQTYGASFTVTDL